MTDIIRLRRKRILSQLRTVCDDLAFYARGCHVDSDSRLLLKGSGAVVEDGRRASQGLRRVHWLIRRLNEEPRVPPKSPSATRTKREVAKKAQAERARRRDAIPRGEPSSLDVKNKLEVHERILLNRSHY
jgi:hypothetical protein